jgi:hypothetical protein
LDPASGLSASYANPGTADQSAISPPRQDESTIYPMLLPLKQRFW